MEDNINTNEEYNDMSVRNGITVVPALNKEIEPIKPFDRGSHADLASEFKVETRFDNIKKYDHYESGEVRHCSVKGFSSFVTDLANEKKKFCHTTGMLLDESLVAENKRYEFGVNYRPVEETVYFGGYGKVKRCKDEKTGRKFAGKKVDKRGSHIHRDNFNMLEALKPKHEHVVSVIGIIIEQPSIWLLLDWAGETLRNFIRHTTLSQLDLNDFLIQGLQGLIHLDGYGIRHLDIKPGNFCVKNRRLTFIDFGSAKGRHEPIPLNVGVTPYYLSPEIYLFLRRNGRDSDRISGKSDLYQFGLVILNMMSKTEVMEQMAKERCGINGLKVDDQNKKKEYYAMMATENVGQEAVKRYCFPAFKPLLKGMLARSPDDRIDAKQALVEANKLAEQLRREQAVNFMRGLAEDEPPDLRSRGGSNLQVRQLKTPFDFEAEGVVERNEDEELKLPEPYQHVWNEDELIEWMNGLEVPVSSEDGNLPLLAKLLED